VAWLAKALPWLLRVSSGGTLAFTGKGGLIAFIFAFIALYAGVQYAEFKLEQHKERSLQQRQVDTVIKASDNERENEKQRIKEVQSVTDDFENGDLDRVYNYINGLPND